MATGAEYIRKLARLMAEVNRDDHFHALGMRFTAVDKGYAAMELPYSEALVGNPETGVVHGGVLTALLDSCCGFAASSVLEDLGLCPTLDLRIDYMGAAVPDQAIYAEAKVYRNTRNVIFCRATAYQGNPEQPVAYCVANFARLDPEVLKTLSAQVKPFLDAMED